MLHVLMFYVEHHLFSIIDHFSDTTLPIENGQIQIVNWKLVEMLEEEKTIYLCLSNVYTTMRMIKKIPTRLQDDKFVWW